MSRDPEARADRSVLEPPATDDSTAELAPAAGVVDIDVLKEGGTVWKKPLEGAFVPQLSHGSLQAERAALLEARRIIQGAWTAAVTEGAECTPTQSV